MVRGHGEMHRLTDSASQADMWARGYNGTVQKHQVGGSLVDKADHRLQRARM